MVKEQEMTMAGLSEALGDPLPAEQIPFLWDRLNDAANKYPENLALICTHQPADLYNIPSVPLHDSTYNGQPYLRWTYKNLKLGIARFVAGLSQCDLGEGDPIFAFLPNGAEYILACWAADRLGSPFVPINIRNLHNKDEVSHMITTAMSLNRSKSAVVVVQTVDIARQVQKLDLPFSFKVFVADSVRSEDEWPSVSNLMIQGQNRDKVPLSNGHKETSGLILFTSGTTSLPKGCLWAHPGFSYACAQRELLGEFTQPGPGDVTCIVVPNNHAIGYVYVPMSLSYGAAVLYPGPAFSPQAMMDAMFREKCTHTALVPTLIQALLGVKPAGGEKLQKLKNILVGGSAVSPENLRQCAEQLGSRGVEHGFGMTEGPIIFSGCRKDWKTLLSDAGDSATVGAPMADQKVRICSPGTKIPVKRGVPGELHVSSLTLVPGYIGKQSDDFYIGDDGRNWHATGDQAWMDSKSRVFISGRYKEMIIRGGENISPVAIQAVLSKVPKLAALNIQVVGAPDSVAGEVPVAVVGGKLDAQITQEIQETVLHSMGPAFVPDEVVQMDTLGISEYPRTMAGKIQGTKLAAIVRQYREMKQKDSSPTDQGLKELEASVKRLWSRAIGYEVDIQAPLSNYADSITVMKVRDQISKETGKNISLVDMVECNTVAGQIDFLQKQPQNKEQKLAKKRPIREGPPDIDDIAHLAGDPDLFESTKTAIEGTLSSCGFDWTDVEDVMPMYDFMQTVSQKGIVDTWTYKITLLVRNKDALQVRAAVESALAKNRNIASLLLWDREVFGSDIVLNIAIRQQKKLFDKCIMNVDKLKSLQELQDLSRRYTTFEHAKIPGPLFHASIAEIEGTKDTGLIMLVHHGVMDASAAQIFSDDLDEALGGAELEEHVDYKVWADSYYSLRTSLSAKVATRWHVRRLKGLSGHVKAFFPPRGERVCYETPPLDINSGNNIWYSFQAAGIPLLRRDHADITAPVILKAAVSLFNVHRTKHTHALFTNLEASRTRFPFVPKGLESLDGSGDGQGFEASDVAGPTIQMVVNLVEIKPEESVLDFLARLQQEQSDLTKYAAAPLCDIISSLGEKEDGAMILETLQTQIYNWVPGQGTTGTNPYSNYERINAIAPTAVAFICNTGLGGKDADTVFLNLKGTAFDQAKLRVIGEEIECITRWLTDREHWKSAVGGFRESLMSGEGDGANGANGAVKANGHVLKK